jgi:hypothetical protein
MCVRVSSVFALSCVCNGLAAGPITHPRNPTNCLQDPEYKINSDGEEARGPNTIDRRRRITSS